MEIDKAQTREIGRRGFVVDQQFVKSLERPARHEYWRPDTETFTTPLPCDQFHRSVYLASKEMGGKGFLWDRPNGSEPEPALEVSEKPPKKTRAKRNTRRQ